MTPERARDSAIAVPIICAILLVPPGVLLFTGDGRLFGVPTIVAVVFAVWFGAIVATALIGRHLRDAVDQ